MGIGLARLTGDNLRADAHGAAGEAAESRAAVVEGRRDADAYVLRWS